MQATLMTKDVAKEDLEEDSQPNYSEIAYQLEDIHRTTYKQL